MVRSIDVGVTGVHLHRKIVDEPGLLRRPEPVDGVLHLEEGVEEGRELATLAGDRVAGQRRRDRPHVGIERHRVRKPLAEIRAEADQSAEASVAPSKTRLTEEEGTCGEHAVTHEARVESRTAVGDEVEVAREKLVLKGEVGGAQERDLIRIVRG